MAAARNQRDSIGLPDIIIDSPLPPGLGPEQHAFILRHAEYLSL